LTDVNTGVPFLLDTGAGCNVIHLCVSHQILSFVFHRQHL